MAKNTTPEGENIKALMDEAEKITAEAAKKKVPSPSEPVDMVTEVIEDASKIEKLKGKFSQLTSSFKGMGKAAVLAAGAGMALGIILKTVMDSKESDEQADTESSEDDVTPIDPASI